MSNKLEFQLRSVELRYHGVLWLALLGAGLPIWSDDGLR